MCVHFSDCSFEFSDVKLINMFHKLLSDLEVVREFELSEVLEEGLVYFRMVWEDVHTHLAHSCYHFEVGLS